MILIGIYVAGEICVAACESQMIVRWAARRRAGKYLLAAAGCAGASLINPYGYHLHTHIYQYLTEKYHFDRITEFQSLSFHHPSAPYLALLLMAKEWHRRCGTCPGGAIPGRSS